MNTVKAGFLMLSLVVAAMATAPASAGDIKPYPTFATPQERAKAFANVDLIRDCTKPAFDRTGRDGRVFPGMTAVERAVCLDSSRLR